MSSALEQFRLQREAAQLIHRRLVETERLLQAISDRTQAIAKNNDWLTLLRREEEWLGQAYDLVRNVERFREAEAQRFWPAMWRRWAVATAFALASAFAFGSGYVWASRPDQAELASLRSRVELMDFVAQRVMSMTPGERRQFDALMKATAAPKQ